MNGFILELLLRLPLQEQDELILIIPGAFFRAVSMRDNAFDSHTPTASDK